MNKEQLKYLKVWLKNNKFSPIKYYSEETSYIQINKEGYEIHYFFNVNEDTHNHAFYLVNPKGHVVLKFFLYELTLDKLKKIHQSIAIWAGSRRK